MKLKPSLALWIYLAGIAAIGILGWTLTSARGGSLVDSILSALAFSGSVAGLAAAVSAVGHRFFRESRWFKRLRLKRRQETTLDVFNLIVSLAGFSSLIATLLAGGA